MRIVIYYISTSYVNIRPENINLIIQYTYQNRGKQSSFSRLNGLCITILAQPHQF